MSSFRRKLDELEALVREDERMRIAFWLRTPITGWDGFVSPATLAVCRNMLDQTADMVEANELRVNG